MSKKKILIALLGVLLLIQFIPRKHAHTEVNPVEAFSPEQSVGELALLRAACYDCHSNETDYPWYAYIQPVAWWIDGHVDHGREELNFSVWHTYTMKRQVHKLEECVELLENGEMPLKSFTYLHPEARLSDDERSKLIGWFRQLRADY